MSCFGKKKSKFERYLVNKGNKFIKDATIHAKIDTHIYSKFTSNPNEFITVKYIYIEKGLNIYEFQGQIIDYWCKKGYLCKIFQEDYYSSEIMVKIKIKPVKTIIIERYLK